MGPLSTQSMFGLQFISNMYHGKQSPYWKWFRFQDKPMERGKLPELAVYDKMKIGILPTKINPETGLRELAPSRVAFQNYQPTGLWK